MKLSSIFIGILSLICVQITVSAQSSFKKDSVKERLALLDSMNKQSVPAVQLKEKYKIAIKRRNELICSEEKIILENGARATFQTTDNKKIKSILSTLFSISPVDFLLAIRGVKGKIVIQAKLIEWVKAEDIPQLVKLAAVDVVTPEIIQEDPMTIGKQQPSKLIYTETPMGINALDLISSYLYRLFPSGLTPSYESVKTWYDSGKPKEEYQFESFLPYLKEPKVSDFNEPQFLRKNTSWPDLNHFEKPFPFNLHSFDHQASP